jgi:hypothetical protein
MTLRRKIINFLIKKPFVYNAVLEQADLSAFTKKPERNVIIKNSIGLFLIIFSYVIGWPVIIFLGAFSISSGQPLFVIIGGPAAYIISHLVFFAGMYLTGVHYTKIFLRWAVRLIVEKMAGKEEIRSLIKTGKDNSNSQHGI